MRTRRGQVERGVEGKEREHTHQVKVLEAEFYEPLPGSYRRPLKSLAKALYPLAFHYCDKALTWR